jgi:hypothetical protein
VEMHMPFFKALLAATPDEVGGLLPRFVIPPPALGRDAVGKAAKERRIQP